MAELNPDRRSEVLEVAEKLFSVRGYEATSVRDIADVLTIKAGSLYSHINNKEDLLWEIVSRAADRFFEAVRPITESNLVTVEKLKRAIAAHVSVVTRSAPAAGIYTTEWRHLGEPRRSQFTTRRDEYERLFRRMVHDAIREGAFSDVDEKFATMHILSSLNWIYQWYRPDGAMTPEEIARRISDLLFNGLRRAAG